MVARTDASDGGWSAVTVDDDGRSTVVCDGRPTVGGGVPHDMVGRRWAVNPGLSLIFVPSII